MVTEQLIRKEYIHNVLSRDAKFIYDTQAQVLRDNFTNERAMELSKFLETKPFATSGNELKPTYYFRIFPYLRLLDIMSSRQVLTKSYRSKLALYNRVVWGRLYNETMYSLRYGFTQDIKDSIRANLEKANPNNL